MSTPGLITGLPEAPPVTVHLMNQGRMGGQIVPRAVVVHGTDCPAGTVPAIIKTWADTLGKGNGAHFIIDDQGGITQLCPLTTSANHCRNGSFAIGRAGLPGLTHWAPNKVSVGIEVSCPGLLDRDAPEPLYGEFSAGTWPDGTPKRYGNPSVLALASLMRLLDFLVPIVLANKTGPVLVHPKGTPDPNLDDPLLHGIVTTHAILDPENKQDPGPVITHALGAAVRQGAMPTLVRPS